MLTEFYNARACKVVTLAVNNNTGTSVSIPPYGRNFRGGKFTDCICSKRVAVYWIKLSTCQYWWVMGRYGSYVSRYFFTHFTKFSTL